jgi:hypothetical protein
MAFAQRHGRAWRARYKKPNGTWGSRSGFETKAAALAWGNEQGSLIRRHEWIDPQVSQTPFWGLRRGMAGCGACSQHDGGEVPLTSGQPHPPSVGGLAVDRDPPFLEPLYDGLLASGDG